MLGIPIELLIVLGLVGAFFLYTNWSKVSGNSTGLNVGSFGEPIRRIGGLLLPAVAILLLIFFWEPIRDGVASWFVASDANAVIGVEEDAITTWFWLIVIVAALLILWMRSTKRAKSPIRSMSFGETLATMLGITFIGAIFLIAALFLAPTVAGLADWASGGRVQNMIDNARGVPIERSSVNCNLDTYINTNGRTIPAAGTVITVCPSDGRVYLIAEHRKDIEVVFDDTFAFENSNVLQSRPASDFFGLARGGGTANSYEFTVNPEGFRSSGLTHIKLFFRSVN